MTEIRRPQLKEFDRTGVPERVCVRLLSYEERGVLEDMTQTLRKMRSCVFACGAEILTDADVIKVTLVPEDIFARVVPRLILRGFMARDDAGALFSPHLYDRLLRKEERAARKAQADRQWQQMQETGVVPDGLTRKQIAARLNGAKGGRRRNGETPEEYKARREQDVQAQQAQRSMPLMGVVDGGKGAAHNPSKKANASGDSQISVAGFPIDLDQRDIHIPSSSNSSLTDETETQPVDQAQVQQLAARMMSASGLGADQAGFAVSFARGWLGQGVSADLIVSAIAAHRRKMDENREVPRTMGVFKAPVQRAISGEEVVQLVAEDSPHAPPEPEWKRQAAKAWAQQAVVFGNTMREFGDFGRVVREWPEIAAKHGLPDCTRDRAAYEAYFRDGVQVAA
ncbi:MAG: hypothetical protein ABF443_00095 [Acetobacter malorum]|uniref:hypothetical protein n=1 Tax=Acetobacter malorum TaxID=178901 RepID=UPI0039E83461